MALRFDPDMFAPNCVLDSALLRANAAFWHEQSGGRLRAVIKADGYGWGAQRLVLCLEDVVEGFCVLDLRECELVRLLTAKPIFVLGHCTETDILRLLALDAVPNLTTVAQLELAITYAQTTQRRVRVRAGCVSTLGWHGLSREDVSLFAQRAAAEPLLDLELWTQISLSESERGLAAFDEFIAVFRAHAANIVSVDWAHSAAAAARLHFAPGPVRIGIGLFGAYSHSFAALRCALRLEAAVIARQAASADLVAGVGARSLPPGRYVETLRVGYADGFPRSLAGVAIDLGVGHARIASVGMQQTIITHDLPPADARVLLHPATDLVAFSHDSVATPHEVVVGLARR